MTEITFTKEQAELLLKLLDVRIDPKEIDGKLRYPALEEVMKKTPEEVSALLKQYESSGFLEKVFLSSPLACPTCKSMQLTTHLLCANCKSEVKTFYLLQDLSGHVVKSYGEENPYCEKCETTFPTNTLTPVGTGRQCISNAEHKTEFIVSEQLSYTCNYCSKVFTITEATSRNLFTYEILGEVKAALSTYERPLDLDSILASLAIKYDKKVHLLGKSGVGHEIDILVYNQEKKIALQRKRRVTEVEFFKFVTAIMDTGIKRGYLICEEHESNLGAYQQLYGITFISDKDRKQLEQKVTVKLREDLSIK